MSYDAWIIVDPQQQFIDNDHELILKIEAATNLTRWNVFVTKTINHEESPYTKILRWDGCKEPEEIAVVERIDDIAHIEINKDGYSAAPYMVAHQGRMKNHIMHVVGVDTDACVLATALGLFDMGFRVQVHPNLCHSTGSQELHDSAIKILERQIGKANVYDFDLSSTP